MNTSRLVLICLLAAVLTIGVTVVVFTWYETALPKGTRSVPYVFSVAENPGIDLGTDMFRLGALMPRGSSDRTLSISDALSQVLKTNQSVHRVRIIAVGKGSEWISIDPSETTVPVDVKVSVHIPADAEYGVYRGYLRVIPVEIN